MNIWKITFGFAATGLLFIIGLVKAQDTEGLSAPYNNGDCKADFSLTLDSMSVDPYVYHFKDLSIGGISSWNWDFGDGSFSSIQHPVHRFEQAGTYKVCLTVMDITNPSNCMDQICRELTTRDYYSLGGLVFAGDYPLNNPAPAGDTGVAYLYRVTGDQVVFLLDHSFYDYGYYAFSHLLPGKYLVKISLAPGSTHYGNYFSTYSGDGIKWQYASHFTISDSSLYAAEIHLMPVGFLTAGQGIIRGSVKYEQFSSTDLPAADQTTVILANHQQKPIRFTVPDASGSYAFNGLPTGTYYLSADATGKPSTMVTITLTDTYLIADNVNLTIFGPNVQGIPEGPVNALCMSPVYPNPVKDVVNIRVQSPDQDLARILITDPAGRVYLDQAIRLVPGYNYLHFPVHHLEKGVYFILVKPGQQQSTVSLKFIN